MKYTGRRKWGANTCLEAEFVKVLVAALQGLQVHLSTIHSLIQTWPAHQNLLQESSAQFGDKTRVANFRAVTLFKQQLSLP